MKPTTPAQEIAETCLNAITSEELAKLDPELAKLDPELTFFYLMFTGDLLRLGVPVPREVHVNLRNLPPSAVLASLELRLTDIEAWRLPRQFYTDAEDGFDPWLEWALHRRDELESHLLGARLVCLPQGVLVDASDVCLRIQATLDRHDLTCGGTVSRADAEAGIGERLLLCNVPTSWVDSIPWAPGPVALAQWRQVTAPPPAALESFIEFGLFADWVQLALESVPTLRAELSEMIAEWELPVSPIATAMV